MTAWRILLKKLWIGSTEESADLSEPHCTQGQAELLVEIREIEAFCGGKRLSRTERSFQSAGARSWGMHKRKRSKLGEQAPDISDSS